MDCKDHALGYLCSPFTEVLRVHCFVPAVPAVPFLMLAKAKEYGRTGIIYKHVPDKRL